MKKNSNWILISCMILVAAMTRLMPHPPNFTAIGAMALFGGAVIDKNWLKWILPIGALFISDLVINNTIYAAYNDGFVWFHSSAIWVYSSLILIASLAPILIRRLSIPNVLVGSVSASVLFFLTTNMGAWLVNPMYTKDLTGLMSSYVAGIPFFGNTFLGDLFFSGVLFGGYYLISLKFPKVASIKQK